MGPEDVFGFVPVQVVQDLQDIGNWKVCAVLSFHLAAMCSRKLASIGNTIIETWGGLVCSQSRASAIDNLSRALRDVGDKAQLLPSLPNFVAFLVVRTCYTCHTQSNLRKIAYLLLAYVSTCFLVC
jgi:hypothetical protein